MYKHLLLLMCIMSFNTFALPKKVEVWFLSAESSASFNLKSIKNQFASRRLQCQPMGEFCFDPQVGLYKRGEEEKMQKVADYTVVENANKYDFIDPPKTAEREMIKCDRNSFFDIFCGKAKDKKPKDQAKLEIWLDQSSTMRQIDGVDLSNQCKRASFIKSLNIACPFNVKMKLHYFTVHKKEAGNMNGICYSEGTNQMKNIIRYLKHSKREKVIIITDIFEAQQKFINDLENLKVVTIKGLEEPMYASSLKDELNRVQKMCL